MRRRIIGSGSVMGFFCAACLVCPGGEIAQKSRDLSFAVVDGTTRGSAFAGSAAVQHAKALAHWRRQFVKETPTFAESGRFILYGEVAGKNLKDIGSALDKQYGLAMKALDLSEPPLAGQDGDFLLRATAALQQLRPHGRKTQVGGRRVRDLRHRQ